jgi:hypothetical protein
MVGARVPPMGFSARTPATLRPGRRNSVHPRSLRRSWMGAVQCAALIRRTPPSRLYRGLTGMNRGANERAAAVAEPAQLAMSHQAQVHDAPKPRAHGVSTQSRLCSRAPAIPPGPAALVDVGATCARSLARDEALDGGSVLGSTTPSLSDWLGPGRSLPYKEEARHSIECRACKIIPAATYSPTHLRTQYHRRKQA